MARKASIYARVSTEYEVQISALENQVQNCDDIFEALDAQNVDRYMK